MLIEIGNDWWRHVDSLGHLGAMHTGESNIDISDITENKTIDINLDY
tara:strand:- start:417 stop:557 length:141 start_codon:yes stop_codon:yes gene_type:complete